MILSSAQERERGKANDYDRSSQKSCEIQRDRGMNTSLLSGNHMYNAERSLLEKCDETPSKQFTDAVCLAGHGCQATRPLAEQRSRFLTNALVAILRITALNALSEAYPSE